MASKPTLLVLQRNIAEWHRATFPSASLKQIKRKLLEEAAEVMAAQTDEQIATELADCLIVMCALADRVGSDMIWSAIEKMKVNVRRTWDDGDNHSEAA